MSSLRYYITVEDLKHVKNFPVYYVVQADYLEGYMPNKGVCKARDFMYGVFIKELRPYCNRKWVAEELDRVNNEIYDIVKALEDKFPYLFKDKRKYGKGWNGQRMAKMLLEGDRVVG